MNPKLNKNKFNWQEAIARYAKSHMGRSLWQLTSTLILYIVMWVIIVRSLAVSYWLALALSVIAAGLLVRIFIIFHDCTHGSFFKSMKLNDIVGFWTGVLVFTPYEYWRHEHSVHHASAGDLDHRGVGDIWTMTVKEYQHSSRGRKLAYRLARNPFILFFIAPLFMFLIKQRFSPPRVGPKERVGIYRTNLAILVTALAVSHIIGWKALVVIQLPILFIAAGTGLWLFYVQHQFEGAYWGRSEKWDYVTEALKGSSFYRLPKILQWFTGSIGFHHIHHLSPKIPNYYLEKCHQAVVLFRQVKPITFTMSLKSLTFRLWDEDHHVFVGFGYLKRLSPC